MLQSVERRRVLRGAGTASKYLVLSACALLLLVPLLYALYTSLELPRDYARWVGFNHLTTYNYRQIFELVPLGQWYLNTVVVAVCVVLGNVVVNSMAGYALARLNFRGKNLIFLVILAIMMIPPQAYLIPLYLRMAELGWLNSYKSLIIPFLVTPFFIFLMRQSFLTIPRELEEAAEMDGAGKFGIFVRIALPLSTTALVTQTVIDFTWTWNSFLIPVTMTNDKTYFVLTVGLNTLKSQYYDFPTVTMAGVILLTVPIVAVFLAFQRLIVPSLATTGLRG